MRLICYFLGSVAATKAAIYLANDEANQILENSAVRMRLRVVAIESAGSSFVEPPNDSKAFETMLSWMSSSTDVNIGQRAATLRDQYGADTVILVHANNAFCGLGYVNVIYSPGLAFANYNGGCMVGSVWMHELGHTMGCYHDRFSDPVSSVNNPNYLGFGNCWEDASKNDCTCYKSVMVYDCNTTPNSCKTCSGRNYLANYLVSNAGSATGTPTASCGLHIDNNRLLPIKYRKSKQPGGMIFKVTPNIAVASSCFQVTITGWQLRTSDVGDTIVSVTLDGKLATIVSQALDTLVVLSRITSNPTSRAGAVVVTTSTGRTTTLADAFTFQPSTYTYLTTFQGRSMGIWRNNGIINWSFTTEKFNPSLLFDGGLASTEASAKAELLWTSQVGTTANPGKCQYTAGGIQFRYWAYEEIAWCYGDFSLSVLSGTTNQWTKIWNGITGTADGPTPWQSVTLNFPANTVGVKINADTNLMEDCRFWATIKLDNISLPLAATCDQSACGNVVTTAVPSLRPTTKLSTRAPSTVPTRIPTATPSFVSTREPTVPISITRSSKPSARPTHAPSKVPTVAPTARSPTRSPSQLPTRIPTRTPTIRPTVVPTFSPTILPTILPTLQPSFTPTRFPTVVPTAIPSRLPTFRPSNAPSRVPTIVPTRIPSRSPTVVPSIVRTLQPSLAPSFNARQVGQVSCTSYTATQTANATQNYAICKIVACPGFTVRATMCEGETLQLATCTGNTFLQVYDSTDTQMIASNDDFCGRCSAVSFRALSKACQKYTIRQGCFGSTSCSGTVAVIFNL